MVRAAAAPEGNLLGNVRAEDDPLLNSAFVETPDYRALARTTDFHFVVGRRGTGKSALFARLRAHLLDSGRIVTGEVPREHAALALQETLGARGCDYQSARATSRLLWRSYILRCVMRSILVRYGFKLNSDAKAVAGALLGGESRCGPYEYALDVLSNCSQQHRLLANEVARCVRIDEHSNLCRDMLQECKANAVFLVDSLDEGWSPESLPTALLGGLARAAAELSDAQTGVHVVAFVRDNMFRALAHLDPDFSRNVEGAALRLRWTEDTLLQLVAERIRRVKNVSTENNHE